MLTEVQTANPGYQLLPGMYATVTFGVALAEPPVRIPATALIVRADGPQVVTVTNDQKVHYPLVAASINSSSTANAPPAIQVLPTEASYNQAIASLQRATSTTLRDNNVTVVTPPLK